MGVDILGVNVDISDEEKVFTNIYQTDFWTQGSGPGSNPLNAEPYLVKLQDIFNDPTYITILDLGCGDWQLMKEVMIPKTKNYKGFDIVKSVIDNNQAKYSKTNVQFNHISNINEFKNYSGDLLIVKDVLMHWPNEQVKYFISDILPNFRYALITNGYELIESNQDIKLGDYRIIDLALEPFNLKNIEVFLDYPSHYAQKRTYFYNNPSNQS